MAQTKWRISGDYFETCNCDFLCPCITSNLQAKPTQGECIAMLVMRVNDGHFGEVRLGGLSFAIILRTPGPMADGNWTVGLVVDERASEEQQAALTSIASGEAGGPGEMLKPLLGSFEGVQAAPIRFETDGLARAVSIPGLVDQAIEGLPSPVTKGEPLCIDNVAHPANSRLGLAKATRSHVHAFGIDWDNPAGGNNGHLAPFEWHAG